MRILCLIIFLFVGTCLSAQTDSAKLKLNSKIYIIETTDGSIIRGQILSDDGEQFIVKTQTLGAVTVQRTSVKSIKESDGKVIEGNVWYDNPNPSRYVVGASAIPQKRGAGYYQNMFLILNGVNYGITDNISVSGATELFSVLDGDAPSAFCISPRVGYQLRPKLHVGGGLLYTLLASYPNHNHLHSFLGMGLITYGTHDNNLTFGAGWAAMNRGYLSGGIIDRETYVAGEPSFTLSGMWRPARWLLLVTENWYYASAQSYGGGFLDWSLYGEFYVSAGARIMARNFSFDLGWMQSPGWYYINLGLPYLGFTINFQTKQATRPSETSP